MNHRFLLTALYLLSSSLVFFPSTTLAMSECLALNEEFSKFHCYTSPHKIKCEDTDKRCVDWGKRGECKSNPQYMLIYCPKSCEACISGHAGTPQRVRKEKDITKVVAQMEATRLHLKETAEFKAKILRTCTNNHALCSDWAANGECDKNPKFMHQSCKPACQIC